MDPDELLVSFCQHSRELSIASAAALHDDMRSHQTPEERAADDMAVAAAREAAVARAVEAGFGRQELKAPEGALLSV